MTWQRALMVSGLVAGIWLAFFTDKTPDDGVAQAVVRAGHPGMTAGSGSQAAAGYSGTAPDAAPAALPVPASRSVRKAEHEIPILALHERSTLITVGHAGLDGKQLASDAQIFGTQSWVPVPVPTDPKLLPSARPPEAPPLRFTYVGQKLEDGVLEVYLSQGDESYIVREKSVIQGNYRVDQVTPTAVTFTYLPLNQVQRLSIKGTF